MKYRALLLSVLLVVIVHAVSANDTIKPIDNTQSIKIEADMIKVNPQPLLLGDAEISLKVPEKIISTSIYTYTGERKVHQVHDSNSKVIKIIPYELESGEYLLFIETEKGYGIRKVFVQ